MSERLFHLVLDLRTKGLSYNKIIKKIEDEHGAKLSKSQLSDWVSGRHNPFGYVKAFDPAPRLRSELALE